VFCSVEREEAQEGAGRAATRGRKGEATSSEAVLTTFSTDGAVRPPDAGYKKLTGKRNKNGPGEL